MKIKRNKTKQNRTGQDRTGQNKIFWRTATEKYLNTRQRIKINTKQKEKKIQEKVCDKTIQKNRVKMIEITFKKM